MNVNRRIVEWIDNGRPFALALVLSSDGSTPCKAGAKAIIDDAGRITGTVGGGHVESEAQRHAVAVCKSGRPLVLDVNLDGTSAASDGPICGGAMRVLLDPTAASGREAYVMAAEAMEQRQKGALVTAMTHGDGPRVAVRWCAEGAAEALEGFPGAEAIASAIRSESARLFTEGESPAGSMEVLVEPVAAPPRLVIAGGGHIGQALARLGFFIGFEVTVIDDRPEFTDAALFPPGTGTVCGAASSQLAALDIDEETYVVIVTRGHKHDAEALAACIHSPAAYVGMIGSRRKVALMRKEFVEGGVATADRFDRVFTPIGLDIAATTVPEIAVSIAAEIIAVRRRGPGAPARGHMANK
ncbi:MAG: XdhC family protein [Planctomycetota bacterium]|jgi:xanthine dehydrogenase accessory factor